MSVYDNLVGLNYEIGRQDCYSIVQRYFAQNYGIHLRNYARPDRFWEGGLDLYKLFKLEGARAVEDDTVEVGDVLLMPLLTPFATHAAICVDDNLILHHLPNQLSTVERMRPKWSNRATIVLRHPLVTEARKSTIKNAHLHEVLNAKAFRDLEFRETAARILGSQG